MPRLLNNRCLKGILTRLTEWTEFSLVPISLLSFQSHFSLVPISTQENPVVAPLSFQSPLRENPAAAPPLPRRCLATAGSHHHLVLGDGSSAASTSPAIASLERRASEEKATPPLPRRYKEPPPPRLCKRPRLWSEEQAAPSLERWLLAVVFGGEKSQIYRSEGPAVGGGFWRWLLAVRNLTVKLRPVVGPLLLSKVVVVGSILRR
ncbi:hypothetical protein LR48_Vigan01g063100 [Vigna angularis]|uniref:Uncharacterized protein n=1 Tax=Phaseolus angularis TaxID=3914 RepID=A0A0L9TKS4_PHAAN|nr:hypothetical protein LR48_Vigan01g063100 [Vigna angularis]